MARQTTKKKKPQPTEQPQQPQVPQVPASNTFQPKIKPAHCLLAPRVETQENYKQFRKKLKYPKVFCFDESTLGNAGSSHNVTRSLWFLKLYRKTKYLQTFELIGAQTPRAGPMKKVVQRLPKVRSIKLLTHGLRSFQSCPTEDRFGIIFKSLGKLNPSALHVKMASDFGINNDTLSHFIKSVFRYIQTLSNLNSFSLVLKKYSTIFGIIPTPFDLEEQLLLAPSFRAQFKRLKKIEDLRLVFNAAPKYMLEGFISSFDHLHKLKKIELVSVDPDQGKNIIESLSRIKLLESATLYNKFEPNDILSLVKEAPIQNLIIKDQWVFTNKSLPILSQINPKNVNILKLHLNMPLNIHSNQESTFLASFLSVFTKLQSLQLYIECRNDVECITGAIAKQINKFTNLESLSLGICMATGFIVSEFLSHIKDLKQIKKLTLLTKILYKDVLTKNWGEQIQALFDVLTGFVLQNNNLTELRTFWGNFTEQICDGIVAIVKKLGKLDVFELMYKYAFKNHGAGHNKVIDRLAKMLKQMKEEVKEVSIITQCQPHTGSCDSKGKKIQTTADSNLNIKKFFMNMHMGTFTPFYREELDMPQISE